MAIEFDGTNYVQTALGLVFNNTTMAVWVRSNSGNGAAFTSAQGTSTDTYHGIQIRPTISMRALARPAGGAQRNADTTTAPAASTWHHAVATFTTLERRVRIDGGSEGVDTEAIVTVASSRAAFGAIPTSAPLSLLNGAVAVGARWSIVLGSRAMTALGLGFDPPQVQLASLTNLWPLLGADDDRDIIGRNSAAPVGGAPTPVDNPRFYLWN